AARGGRPPRRPVRAGGGRRPRPHRDLRTAALAVRAVGAEDLRPPPGSVRGAPARHGRHRARSALAPVLRDADRARRGAAGRARRAPRRTRRRHDRG
ncbi:MAG: Dipeptide transport system permease protein DppC, partial [uncultured Thermoleophilia bacterium]